MNREHIQMEITRLEKAIEDNSKTRKMLREDLLAFKALLKMTDDGQLDILENQD